MPRFSRSFTAVATALLVFAAQLACVCRVKASEVKPEPAAHACCKHERTPTTPAPGDRHDHQCPHCGDAAFVAAVAPAKASLIAAPALDATPAPAALSAVVVHSSGVEPAPSFAVTLTASTLLRLHCALNL